MTPIPALCMWCLSTPPNHDHCLGEHIRHMGRHGWQVVTCECDCRQQLTLAGA